MPTTTFKGYSVPTTGTESGTWGTDLNTNTFSVIDTNLGGIVTKTLSNAPVTLSAAESQNLTVRLIGVLTGAVLVTTAAQGITCVENATTGAFAVTFTNGIGTPVTINQGHKALVFTDATNGPRLWATSDLADIGTQGVITRSSAGVFGTDSGQTSINFVKDNNGIALTTGIQGDIYVPFNCTLNEVLLFADQTGSMVVNIWKAPYASFPPTAGNSIVSATPPTLSSAIKYADNTLTGWTKSFSVDDILRINIDSVSTVTRYSLALRVTRY